VAWNGVADSRDGLYVQRYDVVGGGRGDSESKPASLIRGGRCLQVMTVLLTEWAENVVAGAVEEIYQGEGDLCIGLVRGGTIKCLREGKAGEDGVWGHAVLLGGCEETEKVIRGYDTGEDFCTLAAPWVGEGKAEVGMLHFHVSK